ncbi:hypothetical protein FEM48_Zijuj05G0165500 [Ziziphus jujuba var. spinosa]|uniref:Uncharacterized protein n=1 Tax=Ziziphus jujuba var. spinosa TaxID=714518 RepID=A0A978VFX0_ZIZJJ|nr:hypothetical protein FEM48_Zijuj05G0165500 [Ziziphus jujuba var. spinosa]
MFLSDFLRAKRLMNYEVAILLEHRCDQLKHMSDKSLKQRLRSNMLDTSAASIIGTLVLSRYQLAEYKVHFHRSSPRKYRIISYGFYFETISLINTIHLSYFIKLYSLPCFGNLCPETVDDANAVVPSPKVNQMP